MKETHIASTGAIELDDNSGRDIPASRVYSDADAVARLHLKPTIPRTLDRLIGLVGVNSTVVSAWPIFFITSVLSLANGGTGGLLIGAVIASIGMVPVYVSLAEKIRKYPTAGG